jgi:hypothetical protein
VSMQYRSSSSLSSEICIDNCEHQRETASSLAMSGRSADASMVVVCVVP